MSLFRRSLKILGNPKLIFGSMFLGGTVGVMSPEFAKVLAPFGSLYMSLLGMCITPLLVVSISSSISGLVKNDELKGQLGTVFLLFPLFMLIASLLGFSLGYVGEAGQNLSPGAQDAIGKLLSKVPAEVAGVGDSQGLMSLLQIMIPNNIFSAMTQGNNLAVLFFSILLGLGIGFTEGEESQSTVDLLQVLYQAIAKIIDGIMYLLPIGLFCLFADHISHVGPGVMLAVGKYIVYTFIGCIIICSISLVYMKIQLSKTWKEIYYFVKRPSIISVATSSSLACIPSMLESFEDSTNMNSDSVKLFVPLSVCLNAVGSSFVIALTALFMMDLYSIGLNFSSGLVIVFGSILTAIAMSGVPGIGALAMMGIILGPLGIPLETSMVLMLAAVPITEGFLTLSNVLANTATISFLAGKKDNTTVSSELSYEVREALDQMKFSKQIESTQVSNL